MSGRKLEQGKLGWALDRENFGLLEQNGTDASLVLQRYYEAVPQFNTTADPLGVLDILDQGQQGACQGHALATVFSICYFLATGRKAAFSRAAGYYLSQKKDGIRGDQGSTLSAGQWVATQHGMCLETDWPYPSRYNPAMPDTAQGKFTFKLQTTKPFRDLDSMLDWLKRGLPVQTGLTWNGSCDEEVVDDYNGRSGGGHSTVFWQLRPSGNIVNINSWGGRWNGDGLHEWTPDSIRRTLENRWTTYIGYAPDGMSFPTPDPLA
jgi:hypothetical protein